jgi:hypothetical protein
MGIFDLFRRRPETPEQGPATSPTADLDALAESARQAVLPGFLSRVEAIERVRDEFELVDDDPAAEDAVDRVWRARLEEERTWAAGDSEGVVARMDFTCCNSCGTTEIDDERTALPEPGEGYRYREERYVFFHQQDSDRLVDEPAQLMLTYSAWRAARDTDPELLSAARAGDRDAETRIREETDRKVGEIVAAALAEEGLTVSWNGDPAQRLAVEISHWRKPLPR